MRLIVIGASGKIGRELFQIAQKSSRETIGTACSQASGELRAFDMRKDSLGNLVDRLQQDDVVYLLSAYSDPNWIFANQQEARELNVTGTLRCIDEVVGSGARLIFMSSVEVFDGQQAPYSETSKLHPLNLYGRMKQEVEEHIRENAPTACVVRTGWSVGWDASERCVVKLTYDTLLSGNAKMAVDNSFSISDVRDLSRGLLKLADAPHLQCCHLASGPAIARNELADIVIQSSRFGKSMHYTPIKFDELSYSEGRGQRNELDNALARAVLGMSFRHSHDIVREKVALLDKSRAENE